jgi:hypothetical protein
MSELVLGTERVHEKIYQTYAEIDFSRQFDFGDAFMTQIRKCCPQLRLKF